MKTYPIRINQIPNVASFLSVVRAFGAKLVGSKPRSVLNAVEARACLNMRPNLLRHRIGARIVDRIEVGRTPAAFSVNGFKENLPEKKSWINGKQRSFPRYC